MLTAINVVFILIRVVGVILLISIFPRMLEEWRHRDDGLTPLKINLFKNAVSGMFCIIALTVYFIYTSLNGVERTILQVVMSGVLSILIFNLGHTWYSIYKKEIHMNKETEQETEDRESKL